MTNLFNHNINRLLELTDEMLSLADAGDRDSNDDSCAILYGILRDSAYQLRRLAIQECESHKQQKKWV